MSILRQTAFPAVLLLALMAVIAGCNGNDDTDNGNAVDGNGDATNGDNGEQDDGADEVQLEVTAEDIAFDTDTITVPAGAHVVIEFTNMDEVEHNMAFYASEDAEEVFFQGEIFTGPDETMTYEFDAPEEPGEYFFRCDPHPIQMRGTFIVE